ncbi:MAG TPA: hypothetical protein PKE57_09120 [Cellvibrionaceae bacterium]|nr:hypothetical protein [Cellvibrionaceae bacterium]HMW50299.1 hypothetical protein [Cellvibrionaceae bacterium]HMW71653.1 hypothetical protein [Cellvibrionaceae bacterium]
MTYLSAQKIARRVLLWASLALGATGELTWAAEAPANLPEPNPAGASTGDESPMMLYLVPWNANPESGKNGKKFTLYQPWGSHFDPLTPVQIQQLNAQ